MDKEKKKRKNKKKKNKQIRTSEDEMVGSESTSVDDTHPRNRQNDQNPISDTLLSYQHSSGTKDAKLDDTIKHLHEENNIHITRMADLDLKLVECEAEKHSWLQKEEALMDKIRNLQEDKTALDLEGARLLNTIKLLERDKASLILDEKLSRETIVDKNKDISRLQAQVVELEEQRRDLLHENKQLTGKVADNQSKLLNLERKISSTYIHSSDRVTKEILNSQVDAARILVDKLITENAELIGKVNELFVELQRVTKTELPSGVEPDQMATEATDTTTFNEPEPPVILNSVTSAGEIEQIQLHQFEDRNGNRELPATEIDEKDVLLSDAPLIGAPYRMISFMAKYVSGADLVSKS